MIPRLLKINKTCLFPPSVEHNRLPATAASPAALCLLENPSRTLLNALKNFADARPEVRQIVASRGQKLFLTIDCQFLTKNWMGDPVPEVLRDLFIQLQRQVENYLSPDFIDNGLYGLDLSRLQLMGILNVTPDSFADRGQHQGVGRAVRHALKMIAEGAAVIDIGGESSRPGAEPVRLEEEIQRVIPVIEDLRRHTTCLISVDTTKAAVAARALEAGANWINDISGLQADPNMTGVARQYGAPVVIMHMQGSPQTMQKDPVYQEVCLEVDDFFAGRIADLNDAGIEKLILDPGIGFGKRPEDNLDLIKGAELFKRHGYPVLYGTSRKSFIGSITGRAVEDRLAGTLATVAVLHSKAVNLLRVHDVAASADVVCMLDRM